MDLVQFVALIIVFALAFYALERIPFPASPPWLKRAAEFILALIAIVFVLQRVFGIDLFGHH